MHKKLQNGQSLYELIIAIVIVSTTLIALVALVARVIAATNYSKNKSLATKYTLEGIEFVRGERDREWIEVYNRSSTAGRKVCIGNLSFSSSCRITGTEFEREAILTRTSSGMEVTVSTSWTDSYGDHAVTSSTSLTDWGQN